MIEHCVVQAAANRNATLPAGEIRAAQNSLQKFFA
jgi:hypothetical protein